ncbi:U4/U6-U5 snRNP complex subunit PRP6 [Kluyveromyces lactis]|uniref:KLLA0F04191p n=1 Tax=Kluyveromyces lactis (strain ATCC 8585 / CBS 2359 / DSM 70799 / NBRC 1267 / NRRL Y-1140 / WM37) TaxID=284590 RepID=Q6CLC0_KLULA|nr:uncharacterized protein KLLA0_F04191g [Kluyveromyces lactis]CAG97977.1 KLLA0F04191p [Kluyveromyces lactis]|eukprot:XP_455269.1 uncharacterized protein KLLA0_F04191g [Kluyveromyces lactis]
METPSFLKQSPPPGYIAGIGRGAVGFSTRGSKDDKRVPARLNRYGRDAPDTSVTKNPNRYRSAVSNESSEKQVKDEDEQEMRVYEKIEQRLKNKKIIDNETSLKTKPDDEPDKLSSKFVDLKRNLATLSEQDWLDIPDASDMTRRNKRNRIEEQLERKTFAAPDTLFQVNVNLSKLTEEREKLLAVQIDKSFDYSKSQLTDDAEYLNRMNQDDNTISSTDLEDIRKNRSLLAAYRKSHPRNPENWISSARIEERANQFNRAKSLLAEGCKLCPKSEAIWLESIRMNASDKEYCKRLVTVALRLNEFSEQLWLKAIALEQHNTDKIKVTRKALIKLPLSSILWEVAVNLETSTLEKLKILKKAVELVPKDSQLWLKLIRLQSVESAVDTLKSAEEHIKKDITYWLLKCQLEEKRTTANLDTLVNIISSAIKDLHELEVNPTITEWFENAVAISTEGLYPLTAKAIITATINNLFEDASSNFQSLSKLLVNDTTLQCTLFSSFLIKYPTKYSIWKEFTNFAEDFSRKLELHETFRKILFTDSQAVKKYPVLVLMYAKDVWDWGSGSTEALSILDKALVTNSAYPEFWLAKLKILNRDGKLDEIINSFEEAESHLVECIDKLVPFYVKCLQSKGSLEIAHSTVDIALAREPNDKHLLILKAQLYRQQRDLSSAKRVLQRATDISNHDPEVCLEFSRLVMETQDWGKARSILSVSLLKNPKSDTLYEALITLELQVKDNKQVTYLIAQGLKACPHSWRLWCLNIRTLPKKSLRKTTFQDALEATKEHPMVITEIGKVFQKEHQYAKAYKWFIRASENNLQFGDPWVWLYICESCMNPVDLQINEEKTLKKLKENEPRYGILWEPAVNSYLHISNSPIDILHSIINNLHQ